MNEYVIAKYIRLSRDEAVSDSLSILNQRALLDRYIEQSEILYTNVLEFVDNGYTGTNYERPGVQEMLDLVRSRKVNCIICKDFSRFGRNILETGYFIEQVFPLFGVRFIAVTDSYDSSEYKGGTGGIDVAFKFLIHEYYCKDLSKKVKSAKHIKMINGESITANAIYGYRKNETGNWEIDKDSADVVRLIFKMALEGCKTSKICDALCDAKHLVPSGYKSESRGKSVESDCLWSSMMILRIIRNEQYIGTYIAGRHVREVVGLNRPTAVDESEWIKIPNHHPAIISKEDFDKVHVKYMRKKHTKPRQTRDYLLLGKIFCGCCHRALTYSTSKKPVFRCLHTYADPNAECHKMKTSVRELDSMVMSIIRKQAEVILNSEGMADCRNLSAVEQGIAECENQIRQHMERHQNYYEHFILHEIEKSTYQSLKDECTGQIGKLNTQLALLKQAECEKQNNQKKAMIAKEALSITEAEMFKEVVDSLVEKIIVFPGNQIEIKWKVSDFAT
ncbi:MAG: recombinase family protein [Oscillospiraceae bacterium]|nr:recombinase family protein [Oscillospiraceae bacterium]